MPFLKHFALIIFHHYTGFLYLWILLGALCPSLCLSHVCVFRFVVVYVTVLMGACLCRGLRTTWSVVPLVLPTFCCLFVLVLFLWDRVSPCSPWIAWNSLCRPGVLSTHRDPAGFSSSVPELKWRTIVPCSTWLLRQAKWIGPSRLGWLSWDTQESTCLHFHQYLDYKHGLKYWGLNSGPHSWKATHYWLNHFHSCFS